MIIPYMYGPLGYSGTLNIAGMILQLIWFIILLPQFKNWIERIGRNIGDPEPEISAANRLAINFGIFFVILGTASQLISALINAYSPNLFSDISWCVSQQGEKVKHKRIPK
jgi:hypothetical protein